MSSTIVWIAFGWLVTLGCLVVTLYLWLVINTLRQLIADFHANFARPGDTDV